MSAGSRAVAVVGGTGVVGRRAVHRVRQVDAGRRVELLDTRVDDLATSPLLEGVAVAVLAHPGPHHADAVTLLDREVAVVSLGDAVDDVALLLDEGDRAECDGVPLVVGAGMSPGLTSLLARHLASSMATVDEIHVAVHGTAGPACARRHHRALAGQASFRHDGAFTSAPAGTGRALCWFPEPVGPYDCYRAELPAPLVLHRSFPDVDRITARLSANRRDRLTSRLPMLTPPHREGGVGAVRVEVRGADVDGARLTEVVGLAEMVGTAAAATACAYVERALAGELRAGLVVPGDADDDTTALLHDIERFGVRLQEFTGVPRA